MRIQDPRGRAVEEAVVTLSQEEVTELLVAASRLDEQTSDHEVLRDGTGNSLALYRAPQEERTSLERQVDWWIGPLVLVLVLLAAIGAFTVARGVLNLLF